MPLSASTTVLPQIGFGSIRHARLRPAGNRFAYGGYFLRLPVRALARQPLRLRWLKRNGRGLFALNDADHGDGGNALAWIDAQLVRAGIDDAKGEIWLHAFPRVLGYVFNPVSFWLCQDAGGALRVVIAEVTNTFGDRHSYLCHREDHAPLTPEDRVQATKVLHVSPFQPVEGGYVFRFDFGADRVGIWIDYTAGNGGLIATLTGRRRVLTNRAILWASLRRPFGSRRVLALIHWQALKLWWKGAGYRPRPLPPTEEVTR